ncbi:short-chain dehydrogenase/oxidoreductase [Aspergillus fumigatus Z5]|nr:short-chain dehydrogenase/oxidoreductase [Aspergillus fumigatus Z5]
MLTCLTVSLTRVTSPHLALVCVFVNSIQQQFVSTLAKELRPFLLAKGDIPTSLMFPQEQLKATNVNVIEIFPPIVQIFSTAVELHDPKDQSDLMETIRGKPFGIPAEEFATKPMEKPLAGDDHIPVSLLSIVFNSWEQQR